VHLPAQILGEEQARIAQEQGRLPDQILGQLPGARQQPIGREHFGDEPSLNASAASSVCPVSRK